MSGLPSSKLLTFLSPLFRFFREAGVFTEQFKGRKVLLDLVGGAVRDHVINTDPRVQNALKARGRSHLIGKNIKDLDLATSASPQTIVEMVKAFQDASQMADRASSEREQKWWSQWAPYKVKYIEGLGEQHGTVTFMFNYDGSGVEDQQIEVTTHRTEEYDDEGRKPSSVNFSNDDSDPDESRKNDSTRRDLSFNSLYMDASGKVIDHHGGINDLIQGTLSIPKKPGETAYKAAMRVLNEDPLRFLRLIRFSGAYAAKPTREIVQAIKDLKGSAKVTLSDGKQLDLKDLDLAGLIENRVAGNRKQVEIGKIFSHGGYAEGLHLLNESGVYKDIFPRANDYNSIHSHLDKLDRKGVKGIELLSVLYAGKTEDDIKHDLGAFRVATGDKKEDARRSLNFSASDMTTVQGIVSFLKEFSAGIHSMPDEAAAKHLIDLVGKNFRAAVEIASEIFPKDAKKLSGLLQSIGTLKGTHIKEDFSGINYIPVNGQDLMNVTGIKGPAIGFISELIKEGFRRHEIH
ncbi:MAG: CCA tRNA nucleotidyltransferase, partial [Micrococcales bacterium]|nr:CCA tRNA nucleotidyltransferase [Micrococcales bacterium]